MSSCKQVLTAGTQASAHFAFGLVRPGNMVFTSNLAILTLDSFSCLSVIQARQHELWTRSFMTTLEDRLVYSPTTCFENYPFPSCLCDKKLNDSTELAHYKGLETIGERYHQFHGVVKPTKKLPWRHRWPDAVRDDVLAPLLALNAERYAEEQARGLQGKGTSKPAGKAAAGGKRRGRPAKAAQAGETLNAQAEHMGLGL